MAKHKQRQPVRPDTQTGHERFLAEYQAFLASMRSAHSGFSPDKYAGYLPLLFHRLTFLYFLQKQGLLAGDIDYFSTQLRRLRAHYGPDLFYVFFHRIVHRLCRTDADKQPQPADLQPLLEQLQPLNGGLLETHPLEKYWEQIAIPDAAFERLFAFFDSFHWQCHDQPLPPEPTVTPSILSPLLESIVNRKQAGAYYTQDDVTAYISKQTLLPALLQTLQHSAATDLLQTIQQTAMQNPDRYIPPAVRSPKLLPMESEREYKARQERYQQVKSRLTTGTLASLHDLVTYNLDGPQLLQDILAHCEDSRFVRACYEHLEQLTILDPTCGSGAFLCAALAGLHPLYRACLTRMAEMLLERADTMTHLAADTQVRRADLCCFRQILDRVCAAPNQDFFILATILMQNLYGVDLMREAVEICRLRLFLQLSAHLTDQNELQHLQRLRFNIRPGNALLGFTHYAGQVDTTQPLPMQRLQLDRSLARSSGPHTPAHQRIQESEQSMHQWHEQHLPFHWCIEFPEVLARGGFAVVIGNPPYVEYNKVRSTYVASTHDVERCGNLYAAVIERSFELCRMDTAYLGLVVPMSICSGERFASLRDRIKQRTEQLWLANFEIFPSRLFSDSFQRLSILLAVHTAPDSPQAPQIHVTRIQRWYAAERPHLLDLIAFTTTCSQVKPQAFPRLASPIQEEILLKVIAAAHGTTIADILCTRSSPHFVYYQEATNYWTKASCRIPFYRKNGIVMTPPHSRMLYLQTEAMARVTMALLNSSLFYVWFATFSDGFHLSHALVRDFPVSQDLFTQGELVQLALQLEQDIQVHTSIHTRNTKPGISPSSTGLAIEVEEYRLAHSKPILDTIDRTLGRLYGLSPAEVDFLIHYDHKYRMGRS